MILPSYTNIFEYLLSDINACGVAMTVVASLEEIFSTHRFCMRPPFLRAALTKPFKPTKLRLIFVTGSLNLEVDCKLY